MRREATLSKLFLLQAIVKYKRIFYEFSLRTFDVAVVLTYGHSQCKDFIITE